MWNTARNAPARAPRESPTAINGTFCATFAPLVPAPQLGRPGGRCVPSTRCTCQEPRVQLRARSRGRPTGRAVPGPQAVATKLANAATSKLLIPALICTTSFREAPGADAPGTSAMQQGTANVPATSALRTLLALRRVMIWLALGDTGTSARRRTSGYWDSAGCISEPCRDSHRCTSWDWCRRRPPACRRPRREPLPRRQSVLPD